MTDKPIGSRPVATGNPDLIRADIERTRDDLGETVQALAGKADMKARTREATDRAKAQVREKVATGVHNVQRQSGEVAHKAAEGAQHARREPGAAAHAAAEGARWRSAPVAATAAGAAAAAAGAIIFLRRRRAARDRARQRLRQLRQ